MIGLSRVVTDYVTIGYLTDVYILDEFRGQGLAKWMMACISETLDEWPFLRQFMLFTMDSRAAMLYKNAMGVDEWSTSGGLTLLKKKGPAGRV